MAEEHRRRGLEAGAGDVLPWSVTEFYHGQSVKMAEEQRRRGLEAGAGDVLPWTVAEFYRGQSVLLTGGSGFVGRVLLEKLLFSCPDIDTVYVLLRPRKGLSVQERLQKLLDVPLFDRVRAQRPEALARLQAVEGDSAQPGLALAEADARVLAERVSVVFHLAASVRFDDPLIKAVRTNACATRDLLELATRMTKLKAFVHVSTTFCNENQRVFDEKLYRVSGDWRSMLALVEAQGQNDPVALRALTTKILGPHCNTYTFTKNMAEHIVDHYSDRLPVGILRPSVVVGTALDPFPGWIDNFNGPMGVMVGAGKGVVHFVYCDPDCYTDYVPCDVVVKGLIMCSCEIATKGVGPPLVYQAATTGLQHVSQGRIVDLAYESADMLPFSGTMYHPCGGVTRNRLLFYLLFLCFNVLPAVIGDALLSATGRKPMLIRLQRRIYAAYMALAFFLMQNWDFLNKRFLALEKRLRPEDREGFSYQLDNVTPELFFRDALLGSRRYLMKEPDSNLPQARRAYQRKYYVHLTLKTLVYATISWMIFSKLHNLLFAE